MAANHGVTYELIPAMDLGLTLLRPGFQSFFHEDNTALIRVIKTGRNPTMRHLQRVHRVNIASLHEKFSFIKGSHVLCEKSSTMAADIYTKAFTNQAQWTTAVEAIGLFSPRAQRLLGLRLQC